MKKYLWFCLLGLYFVGCQQEKGWEVKLSGRVENPAEGVIQLELLSNAAGEIPPQVIVLKNGNTYQATVGLEEPGYYRLNFYGLQFVDFIIDHSNLEINVDGNDQAGFSEIKGSPDMDLIAEVQELMSQVQRSPRSAELNAAFTAARATGDVAKMEEVQLAYLDVLNEGYDKVATLLKAHGPSLATINLLTSSNTLDRDRYFDLYMHVAEELKREWPDFKVSHEFITTVEKMKVVAIGQPAPEIALPDPNGQIVKLSSLRGTYVLVDFWAKWCGPCRKENPNVVRLYHQYKDKGFEVFGVSLDRSKEDWVQGIQEDGLAWTHVSDLKYFNSQAASDYGINAIPFSVLIDPDGVIIGKNLRGHGLEKRLREIFDEG